MGERTGPTVLLVDDQAKVRRSLRGMLEEEGITVVGEARDGVSAVEAASELHPDVVLMDLQMPVMNGIDATRALRRVQPETQVVILTAYDDATLRERLRRVRAYTYLVKGCPPSDVIDAVRAAWSVRRRMGGESPPPARSER
jgi:two-component system invasion response regulator UvrY